MENSWDDKMKYFILLFIAVVPASVFAVEIDGGVGFGVKYAGVVGGQLVVSSDRHVGRGALGLLGGSVGYDFKLAEKYSIGFTLSNGLTFHEGRMLNFTYYFSGDYSRGWNLSLDIGTLSELGWWPAQSTQASNLEPKRYKEDDSDRYTINAFSIGQRCPQTLINTAEITV